MNQYQYFERAKKNYAELRTKLYAANQMQDVPSLENLPGFLNVTDVSHDQENNLFDATYDNIIITIYQPQNHSVPFAIGSSVEIYDDSNTYLGDLPQKDIDAIQTQLPPRTFCGWAYGLTSDEIIAEAQEKNLDVVSQITEEIMTDDTNESSRILDLYKRANSQERAIMDALLIDLCGYSMSSIIDHAKEKENTLEDDSHDER
jgi:hypothetical protein